MSLVVLIPMFLVLIVGLVVYAIVKNRPGIVAAIGGGLLLLLVGGGALSFIGYRSVARNSNVSNAHWQIGPTTMEMNFDGNPAGAAQSHISSFRISWVGLLLVIALPFMLLFALFRSVGSNKPAHERGGAGGWIGAILALAIVGFVGLFGAKYFAAKRAIHVAQQELAVAEMRAAVVRQQEEMQRQAAEMDIHELMNKSDEPRIPLPPSPAPPQPDPPSVVAVAEVRDAKTDEVDADLAAEAKAAVAAIAENNESDGEAAAAAGNAENAEVSNKSEKSVDDPSKEAARDAAKPAAAAAESPAAEAASPPEVAPVPRPSWVDNPPKRVGDTAREVIITDEYASLDECTRATDVYLLLKTYERLMELSGSPVFDASLPSLTFHNRSVTANGMNIISTDGGRTWNWNDDRIGFLKRLGIGVDFARREVVAKDGTNDAQYFETVQRSFGPMHRLYTQIEFTPSVDNELRRRWEGYEREGRLTAVGFGAGGILGLLGFIYGLLKVDTWTKGYYTKRLFLGVPAAIIGLVSLFALMFGP
jgi:uncharacterized coiled-coil protein SlyX